jgi:hypothetical protein
MSIRFTYNMTMHDALTARFTDADEIKDVAEYGCSGGVSAFIYYSETSKFYDEYENEILDYLADCGVTIRDLCTNDDTIATLKNSLVWCTVECWCQAQHMANELEREALAA